MEYEQAFYLKLLMEVGITDELDLVLNERLEQENPLSDITLSLFDCNDNRNKQIHVLNEYINGVPFEQINTDFVFNMLVNKFKSMYEKNHKLIGEIAQCMHAIAIATSTDMDYKQPWYTMYLIGIYYDMACDGEILENEFMDYFLQLLYQKKLINH